MHLIKTIFVIVFLSLPLLTQANIIQPYSDNNIFSPIPYVSSSCTDKAQKDLKQCLEDLPESQWDVCQSRYYKAIANC